MTKAVKRETAPNLPIFGIDTQEVEALRALACTVGRYLDELEDLESLNTAYRQWQQIKRNKKIN